MKRWNVLYSPDKKTELDIPTITAILLQNRKLETKEAIEEFLHPHLSDVSLKTLGVKDAQIASALTCVQKAQADTKTIVIYGDYDVDGVCATAILWETLYAEYKKCIPYIPDRVEEGYGLSITGIDNVIKKYPDVGLIITVDNGISAADAVAYAKEKGISVIVTDHHAKSKKTPKADAILHTTKVCGTGVAYVFSKEIQKKILKTKQTDANHLGLVALATVSDCMPLLHENRTFVKFGLQELSQTERLGLNALFEEAKIDKSALDVYHVGFVIAPRLNAAGRLASAMDSLRLLCTVDSIRAKSLAKKLAATNSDRQTLTTDLFLHAKQSVQSLEEKVLVVAHESYNQGIIGLIASKLTELYSRPSIVISVGEEGVSKGSARSVPGVHIVELLQLTAEHLIQVGGHAMAAGFSIQTEKIEMFTKLLVEKAAEKIQDDQLVKIVTADLELPLSMVNFELYESIQQFSPFGQENMEPTFVAKGVVVKDVRILGKEGKHIKFLLEQNGTFFDAIGFGFAEKFTGHVGDTIDILYTITLNTWNGRSKVELRLKDIH